MALMAAVLALAAACSSGGAATSAPSAHGSSPSLAVGPIPARLTTRVVDVAPIRRPTRGALLKAIIAQLGPTGLLDAHIGVPPHGFVPGRSWAFFRLPNGLAASARAVWSAQMASAVYRDQAPANGFPRLGGWSQPGEARALGGGSGVRPLDHYRLTSEAQLTARIRYNAAALGMRIISLTYLHPEGLLTPVVVVEAPTAFLERDGGTLLGSSVTGGGGAPHAFFGYYVEVRDPSGAWVQSQGYTGSIGTGWGAVDPAYDDATGCGGLVACTIHG
ncbi:MAG: hypothetical protein QOE17_1852 [Gaiellales bacterium]|nr:hypothetical protein [Gaiellales bacterium]